WLISHLREYRLGLGEPAGTDEREPVFVVDERRKEQRRVQGERLLIRRNRRVQVINPGIARREVDVGRGVVRPNPERLLESVDRLAWLIQRCHLRPREAKPGGGIVGILAHVGTI